MLVLLIIKFLITFAVLVVVVEVTVPPKVPVPATVWAVEPFKVNVPPVVDPTDTSILPSLVIFPATANVLPVVPLKTFIKPPAFTVRFPPTVTDVAAEA